MDFAVIDVETANADLASICQVYCSGQSHPFRGSMKVIDWRHEPVGHFISYRSAAAQFC